MKKITIQSFLDLKEFEYGTTDFVTRIDEKDYCVRIVKNSVDIFVTVFSGTAVNHAFQAGMFRVLDPHKLIHSSEIEHAKEIEVAQFTIRKYRNI